MPAHIVLSGLTFSTPDGRTPFSNLHLSFGPERTGLIGRNGVGKTTLLRLISGELSPHSGTVSIEGSFGFLRQLVQVNPKETIADLFGVTQALSRLRRAERGEATIDELADTDWTLEQRAAAAMAEAGLEASLDTSLTALSGGERTRASIAGLMFAKPDFLLLDEPTNNLDQGGRAAIIDLVSKWRGGAVVVSHDRALLEAMDAIVELTSIGATSYGGNWSAYRERKAAETAAAHRDLADAEKRVSQIAQKAQLVAERKARKDSAGRRSSAKGGLPRIALGGRKDRSEVTSGNNARIAEKKHALAFDAVLTARERIENQQPITVAIPLTGLPAAKAVLTIDGVTFGYEPGQPIVRDLSLAIVGPERIGLIGANGSGKTTLLSLIAGGLQPWTGNVNLMTSFAVLDQRVSVLDASKSILENFRRLHPGAGENACRAALARFMFRADMALAQVSSLSGGQILRAGLACVLGGNAPPQLLILDEPTNHLDIQSIEAVEAGLRAYDGALLVVSHDEAFLDAVGVTRRLEMA